MAIGRRGSKGYTCSLAMSYVMWHYLALGDPQGHYGIDRDKQLAAMIFAGKKEQAKQNLWADLNNVIVGSECFVPYISQAQAESLTVYAPNDFQRMAALSRKGIRSTKDMASLGIFPRESTNLAARGPAGCVLGFDEAAHVVNSGTSRQFGDVYKSARPALDQFGRFGFICMPSSTWEMTGKFYEMWLQSLEMEPDRDGVLHAVYQTMLMFQLTSWDPYKDWEIAQELPLFPAGFQGDLGEYKDVSPPRLQPLKGPIQVYDEEMAKEERANPDTFAVEKRCLDPATRVLTADLTWKPVSSIRPGDELIGFDEKAPEPAAPDTRPQRKLRTSTVLRTCKVRDRAFRLTFEDGTSVVCSGNHRWFSDNRWRSIFPSRRGPREVLRPGDTIRWIVDPWEEDNSREAGWLAGIYDGEGSFLDRGGRPGRREFSLTVTQNPGLVLDEIQAVLKEKGFSPCQFKNGRKAQQLFITNLDECLRFIGQIRPVRFLARRRELWEGRAPHGSHTGSKVKTISSIESLPEQALIDIETTTGTFIAEGLISHNSHWATSMIAYLNPGKVDDMFRPWEGRLDGPPVLEMQTKGPMTVMYRAHGDPANVNCRFGFAMAHAEPGDDGYLHAVFDLIHFWDPAHYDDHFIDYDEVIDWIFDRVVRPFLPGELTFDQFNVPSTVKALQKRVHNTRLPKRVQVYQRPATPQLNWATYETLKGSLNMGWVHGPVHEEARTELKFVQKPEGGQPKVVPPDSGPCVTKDIADCIAIVTADLLGEQMASFLGDQLGGHRPAGAMHTSQTDPMSRFDPSVMSRNPLAAALGGATLARGMRPGTPSTRFPAGTRRQQGIQPAGPGSFRRRRS
jgi:hypothetical protein